MKNINKTVINIIIFLGAVIPFGCAHSASFDCDKAFTKVEKIICTDSNLSALDERLSSLYKEVLKKTDDKNYFNKEQIDWLRIRNKCNDTECVTQSYRDRIKTLSNFSGVASETKSIIASASSTSSTSSAQADYLKKNIGFTLLEGKGYPLCKEYVGMLNEAQYIEIPACNRKILPGYANFKEIDWVEITDKELIKKILEERFAILTALNPTVPKMTFNPRNTIERIYEGKSKLFFHKLMLSGDGVMDAVYRVQEYSNPNRKTQYGHCEIRSNFYVDDSLITLDSITEYAVDPYKVFNLTGSDELFLYGGSLYVSSYEGNAYHHTNLNVYAIGNKKICAILAK